MARGVYLPQRREGRAGGLAHTLALGRQQPAHVLSLPNLLGRPTGGRLSAKRMPALPLEEVERLLPQPAHVLAVTSRRAVLPGLGHPLTTLAQAVSTRLQHTPAYEQLLTGDGMGTLLAPPIGLETGDSGRCSPGGNDAASCRWVRRTKIRNGKRKGQGNVNNGKPYREWAALAAAQCAIRVSPRGPRFAQRHQRKSHLMSARKAVAPTLARAGYDIMRDLVPFDVHKAWGCGRAGGWVGVGDGEDKWLSTIPFGSFQPQPMSEGLPPDGCVWRRLCREPEGNGTRKGAMAWVSGRRLAPAGNRRFSGARQVPGADGWLASETSSSLDPDGCVVRRPPGRHHAKATRDASETPSRGCVCPARAQRKKVVKSCARGRYCLLTGAF
jgi:hypothetical protein